MVLRAEPLGTAGFWKPRDNLGGTVGREGGPVEDGIRALSEATSRAQGQGSYKPGFSEKYELSAVLSSHPQSGLHTTLLW